jgi:hypothetical protein
VLMSLSQLAIAHCFLCSSVTLGDRFFVSCHGVKKKGATAPCILAALASAFKIIDELEANLSWAHHVLVVAPHCEET